MTELSFQTTPEELAKIVQIYERAKSLGWAARKQHTIMNLAACHANGCPLDFDRMLAGDDFSLIHDMAGIDACIDRRTGKLTNNFLPRFAKREAAPQE